MSDTLWYTDGGLPGLGGGKQSPWWTTRLPVIRAEKGFTFQFTLFFNEYK